MTSHGAWQAVLLAVRRPGWVPVLATDAAVVACLVAVVRWVPPGAAGRLLTLAAVLLAAATVSLLDDDMAELAATAPATLRHRTLARLALGLPAAAGAWWVIGWGTQRLAPEVWPEAITPLAVTLVAAGTAVGAVSARRLGALPAALVTVLVLTPAAMLAADVPWPGPLRELARAAALDPGERAGWTVVVAGLVVLLATRDLAAPPRAATRTRRASREGTAAGGQLARTSMTANGAS